MTKFHSWQGDTTPDASFGLIYRLNQLWKEADDLAFQGRFSEWNFKLDRIFSNLLFKQPLEYKTDKEGHIIKVELSDIDIELYKSINQGVILAKNKRAIAIQKQSKPLLVAAHEELYEALQMKEYALRKFMYELGLYLKKTDSNPSKAMWNG